MPAKSSPARAVGANPAWVRADQERRRSNSASPKDGRPRRQKSRHAVKLAAIRDQH